MLTKVQKWGNSQGVRVPLKVLEEAKMGLGDEVDVIAQEGKIVISPSQRIRGKYRLEDLLTRMPEGYEPAEEDWGGPVGCEAW